MHDANQSGTEKTAPKESLSRILSGIASLAAMLVLVTGFVVLAAYALGAGIVLGKLGGFAAQDGWKGAVWLLADLVVVFAVIQVGVPYVRRIWRERADPPPPRRSRLQPPPHVPGRVGIALRLVPALALYAGILYLALPFIPSPAQLEAMVRPPPPPPEPVQAEPPAR